MKGHEFEPAYWTRSLEDLAVKMGYPKSALPASSGVTGAPHDGGELLVGLLSFDGSNYISLNIPLGKLLGVISHELTEGVTMSNGEVETTDAVYGYSRKDKWLVLRDVASTSMTIPTRGPSAQTLRGSSLLVAEKPISAHPLVDRLYIDLDGLNGWVRESLVRERMTFGETENSKGSTLRGYAIEYEAESDKSIGLFAGNGCRVSISTMWTAKGTSIVQTEHALSASHLLEIELEQPIPLDDALDVWVYPLRDFFVLLTGVFCSIKSIRAHATDADCWLELYAPLVDRKDPISSNEAIHMPFPYPSVKDKTQQMIAAWLNLEGDARNAAGIVTSLTNSWMMPYDLEFVACASAFEALSRVGAEEKRFDQDVFDDAMASALAAINNKDVREWLKGVVQNRRSARSLARKLIRKLEPIPSYIVPNVGAFQDDHRACRNAYVHRADMEDQKVLRGINLYTHSKAVWLLSYAALLNLIGLSTEEILTAFKETRYADGIISATRNQYMA